MLERASLLSGRGRGVHPIPLHVSVIGRDLLPARGDRFEHRVALPEPSRSYHEEARQVAVEDHVEETAYGLVEFFELHGEQCQPSVKRRMSLDTGFSRSRAGSIGDPGRSHRESRSASAHRRRGCLLAGPHWGASEKGRATLLIAAPPEQAARRAWPRSRSVPRWKAATPGRASRRTGRSLRPRPEPLLSRQDFC